MINICVISGEVNGKLDLFTDADVYSVEVPKADADGETMAVWCFFDKTKKIVLNKGDNVTVMGNIDVYRNHSIALVNCELDKCHFKIHSNPNNDDTDRRENESEDTDINKIVSANMEAIRAEREMTVVDFAETAGIRDALYYRRLNGETNWGLDEIETASRNLGVPIYKIIGERPRRDSLLGNDD